MKKILAVLICFVLAAGVSACGADTQGPEAILLEISERDVDVQYMIGTDLTVFGTDEPHVLDEKAALSLEFTQFEPFESDADLFLTRGTGELSIYGQKYSFVIEDEIMSRVHVTDTNTVYESILTSTVQIGGSSVEISIDFVASEDFSQAVATVSAGEGMLFFGDIFNDYLEYFNMILEGALNE